MDNDIGQSLVALLPRLRRFAIGLSRSADVADDLVQGACERVLAAAAGLPPDTRLDAFLYRTIRNLWVDRIRRRQTRGEEIDVDDAVDLVAMHGGASAERRMLLSSVADAIAALPDDQREVLLLVCVEEASYREASDILGVPIGTVMSRLARARRRIAEATGASAADL
jgi:RNA polymerase sigma-70 factor (ECF subfamily)